jgi:predicted aspartyl protease
MGRYSEIYEGPCTIHIGIEGEGKKQNQWFNIPIAIIDSGSSYSSIPNKIIDSFHIYSKGNRKVIMGDNSIHFTDTRFVKVKVQNKEIMIEASLTKVPYFLIGRDILEEFILVADGMEKKWI